MSAVSSNAGGTSRNKLILFADGTYIELLNWIDKPAEFFDWAGKPPGLIDFALTTTTSSAQQTFDEVSQRLSSSGGGSSSGDNDSDLGITYKTPLAGGRKRKDGKKVSWFVTKPKFENENAKGVPRPLDKWFPTGRLDAPFFCHDVTDRAVRVPFQDGDVAKHPSGATGVLSVKVLAPADKVAAYAKVYQAITGVEGTAAETTGSLRFNLGAVEAQALAGVESEVGIELAPISTAEDEKWVHERGLGIRELKLFVPKGDGDRDREEVPLDKTGIGASVVFVKA